MVIASLGDQFFDTEILREVLPGLLKEGAKNTLIFTAFSFAGGLVIGLALALMRQSRRRLVRWPAATFVDVMRGLPAILVIIIVGFGVPIVYRDVAGERLRWPFGRPGETYLPGCLALALVAGAYISESIRAGIEAVPRGQTEAARSLGMSRRAAMRKVVLPQAFRINIAPLANELALLFKDTALLAVLGTFVGGEEITKYARDAANRLSNTTPLVAAGIVYLIITIPLLQLVGYLERRGKQGSR